MADRSAGAPGLGLVEGAGRSAIRGVETLGFGATLLGESLYWLLLGRRRNQPVRAAPAFAEMMQIGIRAVPIVTLLSGTIGVMLAIQGIVALEPFGAQHQVVLGVALSVTRERRRPCCACSDRASTPDNPER